MDLAHVLRVNGALPRRAVLLPDGGLGDRTCHPTVAETELVSRVCEIVRRSLGQPVYSRYTSELLEQGLNDNSPGAWEAVRDDLMTGDLDLDAAAVVLRQMPHPTMLITCLLGARDNDHFVNVACLLANTLDRMSEEALVELGRALSVNLRTTIDVLASRGGLMTRDVRDALLDGFGRVLGRVPLADSKVAECVVYVAESKRDDLFRLFLHVPPAFVDHKPQIAPLLIDRAKSATCKHPSVSLLARVVAYRPEIREHNEAMLEDIVTACFSGHPREQQQLDCRVCLAAAALAEAVCTAPVAAALAGALRRCAASLLLRERRGP